LGANVTGYETQQRALVPEQRDLVVELPTDTRQTHDHIPRTSRTSDVFQAPVVVTLLDGVAGVRQVWTAPYEGVLQDMHTAPAQRILPDRHADLDWQGEDGRL